MTPTACTDRLETADVAIDDQAIAAEARRIGYRLDPHAVTDRARRAADDRRVSIRPAPDAMTWLGALLPAAHGVAAYAALRTHADTRRGDRCAKRATTPNKPTGGAPVGCGSHQGVRQRRSAVNSILQHHPHNRLLTG